MKWLMIVLLCLGGLICSTNFYLSFLRYPIHRLMGRKKEDYRWVSGIPVVGSLLVLISLLLVTFWRPPWLPFVGIVLIVIDTGGPHWFAGSMLYHYVLRRRNPPAAPPTLPS